MIAKQLALTLALTTMLVGCSANEPAVEHQKYVTYGRYYTAGEVITQDGNAWEYTQDVINERASYDNQPVFVAFDDNGTPDDIYDDKIIGLVWDVETSIYDDLEVSLSESFVLERDGNNIHITSMK